MRKPYPKAFEKYWAGAHGTWGMSLAPWQCGRIKHSAYLAWQAGRTYQRKTYG